MTKIINNKNITFLTLVLFAVSLLLSFSWLLVDNIFQEISLFAFGGFTFLAYIQIVANGTILVSNKYLIPIIILFITPFAVALLMTATDKYSLTILLITNFIAYFGVITIYLIRFLNKSTKQLLDIMKLIWVVFFCITEIVSFIFKAQHWPYQDFFTSIEYIAFIPMTIVFYYSGIKQGYLLRKI